MRIEEIWSRLRDYQQQGVRDIAAAFKVGARSVLYVAPTGSGKTVLFSFVAARQRERDKRSLVLVHRRELLAQTVRAFSLFDVPAGAIARDHPFEPGATIQVASSQLVARRISDGRLDLSDWAPTLIILDEAHHGVSKSLISIMDRWPEAKILGVTATPARLDGKGLGEVFGTMVIGPRPRPLIDAGWLADYRAFSHPAPDFDRASLRKVAGDFRGAEMEEQLDTGICIGNVIEHYERHLLGQRALVYCVGIDHARHMARAFQAAGHPAANLDGNMRMDERDAKLAAFAANELMVLCSCEILGEGLDVPETSGVILVRPTASLTLHLQQVGRGLRPKTDGRKVIILDHVGNLLQHGLPDDDHAWSLDGRVKPEPTKLFACPWCSAMNKSGTNFCQECRGYLAGPGPAGWKECEACHDASLMAFLTRCPACGQAPAAPAAPTRKGRHLDVLEGDLAELEREDTSWMLQGDIRFAVRRCRSLAQLTKLAELRAAQGRLDLHHGALAWARWQWRMKLLQVETDPRRRRILMARSKDDREAAIESRAEAEWWAHTMGYKRGWVHRLAQEKGWTA